MSALEKKADIPVVELGQERNNRNRLNLDDAESNKVEIPKNWKAYE